MFEKAIEKEHKKALKLGIKEDLKKKWEKKHLSTKIFLLSNSYKPNKS